MSNPGSGTDSTLRARQWTRRAFIGVVVLGGIVALVSGRHRFGESSDAAFVARILAFRAPYAMLEPGQRDRFVADYLARHRYRIRRALAAIRFRALYGTRFHALLRDAHQPAVLRETERHVVTTFLLSTDFFAPSRVGSDPLSYRGMRAVCGNPFARYRSNA